MTPQPGVISLPERRQTIDATLLPQIIDLYIEDKVSTGAISLKTARNYRSYLAPWVEFWELHAGEYEHHLSPEVFRAAEKWMRTEYLNKRGWRPDENALAYCFKRLRQVLKWAYEHNCTGNMNIMDWCPALENVPTDVLFPSMEEIQLIFAQPAGEFRLRDLACMAFLLSTGARRMEVAKARVEALTFLTPATNLCLGDDHRGYCELRHVKGDAEGTGRRARVVAFCSETGLLLKAYLRTVNRTYGPIFDMSDVAIGQMVERHAEAAGIERLSPHAFRRCLSDYWDEVHGMAGREALKKQLGHTSGSPDVTEKHYISRNFRRIAREILKMHVSPVREAGLNWSTLPVHMP